MKENIIKSLVYINKNNPSNHLPYHGIDHLFEVYDITNKITYSDPYVREHVKYRDELLIAALFHDYDHSGGELPDSKNIEKAINGCINFLDSIDHDLDINIIKNIIKATTFPSPYKKDDLTLEQQIIQDADMCYLLKDMSIVKLYSGLRKEFNQSLDTFLKNQMDFLESVKFNTNHMAGLWVTKKPIRIQELKELIKHNE